MKKLYRATEGRKIAGVCQGLSEYFGIDVNIIRLVIVIWSFFGGFGLLFYITAALIIPEKPAE